MRKKLLELRVHKYLRKRKEKDYNKVKLDKVNDIYIYTENAPINQLITIANIAKKGIMNAYVNSVMSGNCKIA